jgi:hypothetical protein
LVTAWDEVTVRDAAVATVESLTDVDFADLPPELQADLASWWRRFSAWRLERDVVVEGEVWR